MYQYTLESRAQEEYEKSLDWYAERSEQAAINFIKIIDTLLDSICKHPYKYKKSYKNYYEANARKYPFSVIYSIEEVTTSIIILSIFHHKRNPKKKYKK